MKQTRIKNNHNQSARIFYLLLGFILSIKTIAQPSFLLDGLVAHYSFDGNINDNSTNQSNGKSSNLVFGSDRFGVANRALLLTGKTNATPEPIFIKGLPVGNSPRTFSLWIKTDGGFPDEKSGVGGACLFSYGSRSPVYNWGEWLLKINGENPSWGGIDLGESFINGSAVGKWKTGTSTFVNGKWQHLTVTYDGNTKLLFFINGNQLNWGDGAFAPPLNTLETAFSIGKTYWGQNPYVGLLDDLRIFNRCLTSTDVKRLYLHDIGPVGGVKKAVYYSATNLTAGQLYKLQLSSDLENWVDHGLPFIANETNWKSSTSCEVDNYDSLYFRLIVP